ncbi:MAG: hypothetical protein NC038_02040 [Paludibacter sp.]|nr:hypothetical protein [Bacteroidales bacterium]MCM1068456.1 hypothetical protein [Prevotella sp.]MCM1353410.1 hypothetical protein [Bacteroides sp.]MCM1442571.1 hypothetical protein [Muribaculum sp.]MCM1481416.1 hypothetical protein [Paludibacter sp.]
MKKTFNILLLMLCSAGIYAQNDTIIERTVTVEREYEPTVRQAGKLSVKPQVYTPVLQPIQVRYSDYADPLALDFNFNELGYSETNFLQPRSLHGFLRGGIGHINSVFDFTYRLTEKKDILFDIDAHHLGQWGRKTLSDTWVGLNFSKLFTGADLYFGVTGKNTFFTRYGRYFDYDDIAKGRGHFTESYKGFDKDAKGNFWEVDTKIGVRSLPNADIRYMVQTGYEAFVIGHVATEHQINTQAMFEWRGEEHHAGGNLLVQNRLYSVDTPDWQIATDAGNDTILQHHHVVKFEPYYEYQGKRFGIHAGVNVDFAIGKGKLCLPSPNVTFEAKLTEDWLALYGGAVGDYMITSVRDNFHYNRYLHPELELTDTCNRTYMPVDAFLGFKIRPQANLLIDIYAHYMLTKYDVFYQTDTLGYFTLVGSGHQRWKIGGKVDYHYQDIVNIHLDGNYTFWKMDAIDYAFYRPSWEINFRVDAKINSKISLYSDNYFAGGQYACVGGESVALRPTIDLNLGVQYNINKWLACYLQLNNYLNRKHDMFYGYQTQGINFVAGVTWSF